MDCTQSKFEEYPMHKFMYQSRQKIGQTVISRLGHAVMAASGR